MAHKKNTLNAKIVTHLQNRSNIIFLVFVTLLIVLNKSQFISVLGYIFVAVLIWILIKAKAHLLTTIAILLIFLPLGLMIYYDLATPQHITVDNWSFFMMVRIATTFFCIATGLIGAVITMRIPHLSKSRWLHVLVVLVFYIGGPLIMLNPIAAIKDLEQGAMPYIGACDIKTEIHSTTKFDHVQYYLQLGLSQTKYRISNALYGKLAKENTFSDILLGYDGPCQTYTSLYYLENSRFAFE